MKKYNEIDNKIENSYKMALTSYLQEEIFEILKNECDELKIFALLNLKKLENIEESKLLFLHLTNQKGAIREIVSYKIAELLPEYFDAKLLTDAICDVNPNVSRNIIFYLQNIDSSQVLPEIVLRIEFCINEIDTICKKFRKNMEKNHVVTKIIFHLYWLLEAFSIAFDGKLGEKDIILLEKCSNFYDYTIREKVAQILIKSENAPVDLIKKLKNDENFYVRNKFLT